MSDALVPVRYSGPHDEVEIRDVPGATCKRNGTVSVPEHIAASLVEQDSWSYVKPPRKRAAAKKTAAKKTTAPPAAPVSDTNEKAGA